MVKVLAEPMAMERLRYSWVWSLLGVLEKRYGPEEGYLETTEMVSAGRVDRFGPR